MCAGKCGNKSVALVHMHWRWSAQSPHTPRIIMFAAYIASHHNDTWNFPISVHLEPFVSHLPVCWQEDGHMEKCKSLLEQLRQLIKTVGLAKFQVRFSWIIQILPVWPTLLRCFRVTAQISAREANHRIFPLAVSSTVAQHVSIVSGAPLLPSA